MENFKGNSNVTKQNEKEKVPSIKLTSEVTVKKPSEITKFRKQLISEDAKTVGKHILTEVIIPGFQKLISDMVKNGIDWLIYGVGGKSSSNISSPFSNFRQISYDRYYSSGLKPQTQPTQRASSYEINDILFDDKGDAVQVLSTLKEWINRYGRASVGDFYDLVNVPYNFTDESYGWKDLSTTEIIRTNGKYLINFARPIVL